MKIKSDVVMTGLQIPMRLVLIVADQIWKEYGQELVITSALDGTHSAGSLHYYGYALDFRTRYFTNMDDSEFKGLVNVERVAEKLREALGRDYNVIVHKSHIHVEYDKAKEMV